ncbi:MAG: stage II sporulation protein M [Acidobacteria bacterium]|nr:stage II sporulation protein M [Acidobacteriota bacterium]
MNERNLENRIADWKRLEQLISQAGTAGGLQRFARFELRELARIYRRTATDLAIARVESKDQQLVEYLNRLLIRAHGLIYRPQSRGKESVRAFFQVEFPALVRQTYRYHLFVVAIFFSFAIFSFAATLYNSETADHFYISPQLQQQIRARHPWWETLNKEAPSGAAAIIFNNAGIGLKAFSMSIFPVVGTVMTLLPTALMFGSINALIISHGMTGQLWSFMIGHMVLEFAAIFIGCGAGMMIGLAILVPGERTRKDALIEKGQPAIKLLAGCLPLFVLAGLIEAFISPLVIHPIFKVLTSLLSTLLLIAYLLSRPRTG